MDRVITPSAQGPLAPPNLELPIPGGRLPMPPGLTPRPASPPNNPPLGGALGRMASIRRLEEDDNEEDDLPEENNTETTSTPPPSGGGALAQLRADQLQGINTQFDQATASRRAAYQEAIDRASRNTGSFMERLMPWLAFSAGMLSPTRTGSFGEALSNATQLSTPLFNTLNQDNRTRDSLVARLTGESAKLDETAALNRAKIAELLTRSRSGGANRFRDMVIAAGLDPDSPEGHRYARQLIDRSLEHRPLVQQNIGDKPEGAYGTRVGTGAGNTVTEGMEAIPGLIETRNLIEAARGSIERGGPTGNITPMLDMARSAAASFGININTQAMGRLSEGEQLSQISSLLARGILGSFSRTTDRDTAQALLQVPTRGTTREGNLMRSELLQRLIDRRVEVINLRARLAARLQREGNMEEFGTLYSKEVERLPPLFDEDFRKRVAETQAQERRGETNVDPTRRRNRDQGPLPEGIPEGSVLHRRLPNGVRIYKTPPSSEHPNGRYLEVTP